MRWLVVLAAVGCSDRPIPTPDVAATAPIADLGRPPDLAQPMCGGGCLSEGCVCTTSQECCTTVCDPQRHVCTAPVEVFDLAPPLCSGPGDCVVSGCPCSATGDCCAGLMCIVPLGAVAGTCLIPPPPPDMSCTEGVRAGGTCTTTVDCCGVNLVCIIPVGAIAGTCTVENCVASDQCFDAGHCCTTDSDCCLRTCAPASDGVRRCFNG